MPSISNKVKYLYLIYICVKWPNCDLYYFYVVLQETIKGFDGFRMVILFNKNVDDSEQIFKTYLPTEIFVLRTDPIIYLWEYQTFWPKPLWPAVLANCPQRT